MGENLHRPGFFYFSRHNQSAGRHWKNWTVTSATCWMRCPCCLVRLENGASSHRSVEKSVSSCAAPGRCLAGSDRGVVFKTPMAWDSHVLTAPKVTLVGLGSQILHHKTQLKLGLVDGIVFDRRFVHQQRGPYGRGAYHWLRHTVRLSSLVTASRKTAIFTLAVARLAVRSPDLFGVRLESSEVLTGGKLSRDQGDIRT